MTAPALYGGDSHADTTRYPIGPLVPRPALTPEERAQEIARIAALPQRLRHALDSIGEDELDERYRPEGWTVRQVVHHIADSHINAYMRCRLAITEPDPVIKPYDEAAWAELCDAREGSVETSLVLLDALHSRLVTLLRSLEPEQFARTFQHPEHRRTFTVDELVSMYAWHGDHHVAHIELARKRH